MLTSISSLKKVGEAKFLTFLGDIANRTISIQNPITKNKNQNILYTYQTLILMNIAAIVPEDVF